MAKIKEVKKKDPVVKSVTKGMRNTAIQKKKFSPELNAKIDKSVETQIKSGVKTVFIRSSIVTEFHISECRAASRIKIVRKKLGMYNYKTND